MKCELWTGSSSVQNLGKLPGLDEVVLSTGTPKCTKAFISIIIYLLAQIVFGLFLELVDSSVVE